VLVAIHQPNYLPWPGFFHKWMLSDAFVVLDTVQFSKNDWQNRNRIKASHGVQWLTVPVRYQFPARLADVKIAPGPWARKHRATLAQAYGKAPYSAAYSEVIDNILSQPWCHLCELNIRLIRELGAMLGCKAPLYVASQMQTQADEPSRRLVMLCRELGATAYLSGVEGRKYLDTEEFDQAGVELWFQEAKPPVYPQLYGEFISHLSVVDLLFNVGSGAGKMISKMGRMVR